GNQRVRKLTGEPVIVPPDPIVQLTPISVVNALSLQGGSVAPGEIVSIFGAGLGPESGMPGGIEAAGLLANLVAGVEVRFDGVPAPLFYVENQQINAQVPYTIAGASTTHIEVRVQGKVVGSADVPVVTANPALLSSIVNPDGTLNGEASPGAAGGVVPTDAAGAGSAAVRE